MRILSGQFTVAKWEENSIVSRPEPQKLNEAIIEYTMKGDLIGSFKGKLLMAAQNEATATYVGILVFEGTIGEKRGQFAVRESGSFLEGVARSNWEIIARSGTGDFADLKGEGQYAASDSLVDYRLEVHGA